MLTQYGLGTKFHDNLENFEIDSLLTIGEKEKITRLI